MAEGKFGDEIRWLHMEARTPTRVTAFLLRKAHLAITCVNLGENATHPS